MSKKDGSIIMTQKELNRLANLCYYDFDMSEGEDNCKGCPRYFKCREQLEKENDKGTVL